MRSSLRRPRASRWITAALPILILVFGARAATAQTPPPTRPSPAYGTTDPILSHVGYSEFLPASSLYQYVLGAVSGHEGLWSAGGGIALIAHPHVPSGARLVSLELDYCDTNLNDHMYLILSYCDYLGANCQDLGQIMTAKIPFGSGCGSLSVDLTPNNFTLDNNAGQLRLTAGLSSGDFTNVLVGVYVGYKLQVSAAPAVATFADVPTSSPQFKFVEALVAAGITAGCGGGKYCPNDAITRGQMAVFLATALGLHFPN